MNKHPFEWAVVGAGAAGIAAVGKLLDKGVKADTILWLDRHFKVGDLGQLWSNVSSNTSVQRFIDFLNDAESFAYNSAPADFALNHLPPEDTCILKNIVEPLQWVSDRLNQEVHSVQTAVHSLSLSERSWSLTCDAGLFKSKNVILATGSVPATLNYPGVEILPLEIALNPEKLAKTIDKQGTYGVFGSSHSAIIILRYLVELGVKKVINFYRSPSRYAIDMGNWILFDNTGLKGETARWARECIDGSLPANLVRYNITEQTIARYLPECHQVIYAVGFRRRQNLVVGDYEHLSYNSHAGIIGPGLFGLGIAFPEEKKDPLGIVEKQVGLWKFMVYLNKVLPIWFKYPT